MDDRRAFGGEGIRMEYVSLIAVWAVGISGPCVICWLAGDMAGSARTQRLYSAGELALSDASAASAYRVDDWRVRGRVHPLGGASSIEEPAAPSAPCAKEQAAHAEHRRQRRAALAAIGMRADHFEKRAGAPAEPDPEPSLAHPDPAAVLHRYERSVEALQLSNMEAMEPITVCTSASDLYPHRLRSST
ncbi:MAG: hypothetical protein HRT64_00580 [Erythrobacter sp.]|nr:hypothetical protein [Erythrobacter sp.]